VSLREASLWTGFYVSLAVLFGIGILVLATTARATRASSSPAG
jgi:hypothetical protein